MLSDRELTIMHVLWREGPKTAQQIQRALSGRLDNSTVRTFLRILERKGHVTHAKRGRAFVFEPTTTRDQAVRLAVDRLLKQFFDGSREALRAWLRPVPPRPKRPIRPRRAKVEVPQPADDRDEPWLL